MIFAVALISSTLYYLMLLLSDSAVSKSPEHALINLNTKKPRSPLFAMSFEVLCPDRRAAFLFLFFFIHYEQSNRYYQLIDQYHD